MQSNILFTRGSLPKIQSTWGTSQSNLKQGHVRHGKNSNSKDRTLWIVLHILEIKGAPFTLNIEAYDKAISWGTSFISIFFHENTGAMDIKSARHATKGKRRSRTLQHRTNLSPNYDLPSSNKTGIGKSR